MKLKLILISLIFAVSLFSGCKIEVSVKQSQNEEVEIVLKNKAGVAILKTLDSFGVDGNQSFSSEELSKELSSIGFSKTLITGKIPDDFTIQSKAASENQYLYKIGLLKKTNAGFCLKLSPENLKRFYDDGEENLTSLFDMFFIPVFSGDPMSKQEYIDLIAEVYGNPLAQEIAESTIKIKIESKDGKKNELNLQVADLFTLSKEIELLAK